MQARTAFVDDAVLSAMAAGVTQVVVVGAGYDDRALRFRTPGVRFFEVDHPLTQADKRGRVEQLGAAGDVSFVPVDLARDDLGSAFDQAGHDDTAARFSSLRVCWSTSTWRRSGPARRSAPTGPLGSRLVASLAIHADGSASRERSGSRNSRREDPPRSRGGIPS